VADFARVPKVIPHQPLDRQRLVARVPQPIGDSTLLGLVENVCSSGVEVQFVPQPQQELAGRLQSLEVLRQHSRPHQVFQFDFATANEADPANQLDIGG
jgi:hypothetical protein